MVISRSARKTDDAKKIKNYWESSKMEGGGLLHDILQDRNVEDIDILWCLKQAMDERDYNAIMICGYLLSIIDEDDRNEHLRDILGYVDS